MSYRLTALAAVAAALALQGCATTPPPPAPGEDFNFGIAKSCAFTPVQVALGGTASSTITMSNDGWCAVRVEEPDGQPFLLGLMAQRPEHGRVLIQRVSGQTRLEYTPNPGFTGTDRFTAALRARETGAQDSKMQIAVNVVGGAAPPPVAETPATTTRTTTTTTRSPTRAAPVRRTTP